LFWSTKFNSPVPLPEGGHLLTLDDARVYLIRLPEQMSEGLAWLTAMELVLQSGTNGGPTDTARKALMEALYAGGATPL
jgi:hypothetical protein